MEDVLGLIRLDGVAMVTGGASGIGRATAQMLVSAGAKVAIVDIDKRRAEEAAAQIASSRGQALAFACDASDERRRYWRMPNWWRRSRR